MAYGSAGAHREELKDGQLLSLRAELRSYRLNGSGMNKIVRRTSATPWSIKRSNVHVQTCNRCSDSALPLGSACMTEYLIAARAAIILWTSLAVMPAEIVFDAIEAELERRGVES